MISGYQYASFLLKIRLFSSHKRGIATLACYTKFPPKKFDGAVLIQG